MNLRVQGGGHLDNLNLGVVVQSILSILTTDARFLEATKLNKAGISIKWTALFLARGYLLVCWHARR